ncbi:hypothetical protein [Phenylobacterium sp.]|uniref:hypothetical protein n=1 Tax=Phenylobacterium sp. TaxID=1871053 RepID=UPI002735E586|nr:hypothetical protein [Phenylobacterium sp.]MDP3855599.1 hypothetical protein [Phenylobacterium sp.]
MSDSSQGANGRSGFLAQARRRLAKRRGPLVAALSVVGHAVMLIVMFPFQPEPPRARAPEPMPVELVQAPRFEAPKPEPEPPGPPTPSPAEAAPAAAPAPTPPTPVEPRPRRTVFRQTPAPPPDVAPMPAGESLAGDPGAEVSDGQLAGAATAGSGGGGGDCNMPRRLQAALRRDRLVQAAVAEAHRGKALMVWNGNWVRHRGQEGSGLAAVREAMMWEIGFAPEACRTERVRGLVLLSLSDGPGSARLVVGSSDWRWSDLLFSPSAARSGAQRP